MKLHQLFEGRSVTVKGNVPKDFPDYIRSERGMNEKLQELYGSVNIDGIVKMFADHNIVVADNVTLPAVPTDQLYKYREYDREMKDGWTGKATQEEYDALKQSIGAEGIREPVILDMTRNHKDGSIEVKLGEGNHRLKIARELGITQIPVQLYYRK